MIPRTKRRKNPTPLPSIQEASARCNIPEILNAYRACLQFEEKTIIDAENASGIESGSRSNFKGTNQEGALQLPIIYARILGYLLYFTTSHQASVVVTEAICSCDKEGGRYEYLEQLGEYFLNHFIRDFRKRKRKTPATSERSSCPSLETEQGLFLARLKEVPKNHTQAKDRALLRDGYRCVITGKYDALVSRYKILSDEDVLAAGGSIITRCAHILSESLSLNVKSTAANQEMDCPAPVLALLRCFVRDVDGMNSEGVHSLLNVMTMDTSMHEFFDRLEVWFERMEVPNRYRPTTCFGALLPPQTITFTFPDPSLLPVPSPEFLALHALCSKVAHKSGALEYFNGLDYGMEDLDVLASDGSSSTVLHHVIWEKLGASVKYSS